MLTIDNEKLFIESFESSKSVGNNVIITNLVLKPIDTQSKIDSIKIEQAIMTLKI